MQVSDGTGEDANTIVDIATGEEQTIVLRLTCKTGPEAGYTPMAEKWYPFFGFSKLVPLGDHIF